MIPFAQLASRLAGELHTGDTLRRLYATDASEYQELPAGVALPKTEDDIREIIRFASRHGLSLIPRAAGTSLAGQCVGSGLVVDISKHLTAILEIDPARRRVRVQPGVVRNELNHALAPHGLFFGPETSTANRAMIGGMMGNNSCGSNSIVYGSVRDHLVSVKGLLSDGTEVEFGPLTRDEFIAKRAGPDSLETRIYQEIEEMLGNGATRTLIREHYPNPSIPRRNTGYALDLLMDAAALDPSSDQPFNFCRLIAGSEGTLFFATEIELGCSPLPPPQAALVCGHFTSVNESLHANLLARPHAPTACELIDRHILDCTKSNLAQLRNRDFVIGDPGAILVVEIRRDSRAETEAEVTALTEEWALAGLGYAAPVLWNEEGDKVWELRRAGQGLMSNVVGDAKPREVVEDTAVDVRDLPAYIAEFDALLRTKYGIDCVYYAHAGSGELHTRPLFDLKTPEGLRMFRGVATDIALLVKKYRGSLSGEHGDGRLRGEFIPLMVGDACYQLMRRVKAVFDPDGVFNPGKIIDTPPMDTSLRHIPGDPTPDYETIFDFSDTLGVLRAAEKCNGSGDCRKGPLAGGTMCPSYMVTREEQHSTRARANILRHVLTHPADSAHPFDSAAINEVMDLCLSCKACKSECPSSVDIARLKAEFLQHYHDVHGVPFRSWLVSRFAASARLASLAPWLYNAVLQKTALRRTFNILLGFHPDRTLPRLNRTPLHKWFAKRTPLTPLRGSHGRVHLFCDEFTDFNDLDAGIATVELLELLGYGVVLPAHTESGRASFSKGLLRRARTFAEENVRLLAPVVTADAPLIGIEPSAILGFRDEYPILVGPALREAACGLAPHCLMLDEFIAAEIAAGRIDSTFFTREARRIHLHGHCHQKALASMAPTVRMLALPENYRVTVIPSGCCGMAGSFGYEKEHHEVSMQIGELVLFPAVREAQQDAVIAAPGTSCRHQIHDGTGRTAIHPAIVLRQALRPSVKEASPIFDRSIERNQAVQPRSKLEATEEADHSALRERSKSHELDRYFSGA
ncbi:MAG: FAD-binding protein [Akkermansiaceae bacterium]|nr:FAD-binding protein [Akkermansiaceae bacterium]MCF7731983.1 FAD-binding protein [Akkermansiaceae bacterium]